LQLPLSTTVTLRHVPHQTTHTRTHIRRHIYRTIYVQCRRSISHAPVCTCVPVCLSVHESVCLSVFMCLVCRHVCRYVSCVRTHHTSHRSQEHELSYVQRRDRSCTSLQRSNVTYSISLNARGENAINIHLQAT
jgi:hypothetical protein